MDEPQTNPRATSRRPVWARITLVVGLAVAGTLLTSMLLSATGIGAEGSTTMGQHGPGGGVATDAGGDRGHDRPPGDTGDHSGPTQGGCP
jgi:hypothetical protein